jgi:hypothetical protein
VKTRRHDAAPAERPRRRPEEAAGLRTLQRELGNRRFAAALGRRTLARDVEADQLAAEAKSAAQLKDDAAGALAVAGDQRAAKAISITTRLLAMYVPESLDRLVEWRYVADAKGFELVDTTFDKAEKHEVAKLHVGDDVLKRLAAGKVDEVAEELRRALQQLNEIDIGAGRAGIVRIGGERVRVKSREEMTEAARIIQSAKKDFGIAFDSLAARRSARAHYAQKSEPEDRIRSTDVAPWEFAELQGLDRAMKHYPMLGHGGSHFTFGKLNVSAEDTPGDTDDHSAGQTFETAKTVVLYDALPKSPDRDDPGAFEFHATHELAHALFGNLVDDWVKASGGYWSDVFVHGLAKDAEAPPDGYASKNAKEDLAQSIAYFILNGEWFAKKCPQRARFLKRRIGGRVKLAATPP